LRHRFVVLGPLLIAALLVGGCTQKSNAAGAKPKITALPTQSRLPAGFQGGACQLLDYDVVAAAIGVQFEIAAASDTNTAHTCVLQLVVAGMPDFSLSVSTTMADATIYKSTMMPKDATAVNNLGKIGYSEQVPAAAGAGPGLEIGWLSANQRLMVVRYRSKDGTSAGDVNALLPKLVTLAQKIDQASV
jgi:hypothetical protein